MTDYLGNGTLSLPYLHYVAALQFAVQALILGGQTSQQSEPESQRKGSDVTPTLTVTSGGTQIFLPFVTLCIQVGLLQRQLGLLKTCKTPGDSSDYPTEGSLAYHICETWSNISPGQAAVTLHQ